MSFAPESALVSSMYSYLRPSVEEVSSLLIMVIRASELDLELPGKQWQPWLPSGSVTPAARPCTHCKVPPRKVATYEPLSTSSIVGLGELSAYLFVFFDFSQVLTM